MDATRALLDSLMGPNRNAAADAAEKDGGKEGGGRRPPDFCQGNVCKNFLVGFCPHDWFSKGRALRPCNKIHSELMRANMEHHPDFKAYRAEFEEEFLKHLEVLAHDCDAFIVRERSKCRGPGGSVTKFPEGVQARADEMEKRYTELLKKSEDMADESVSKSREYLVQAQAVKEELDQLKAKYTTEFAGEDICEICGVRYPLGAGSHDKESHYRGKTHAGYMQIRDKIKELRGNKRGWEKERRRIEELRDVQRKFERKKDKEEREKDREKAKEREKEQEKARKEQDARERERERRERKEREARDKREKEEREKVEKEKQARDRSRSRESRRRRGLEETIPALWERVQRLPPAQCQAALADLDDEVHDRLEEWLVARVSNQQGPGS